MVPDPTWVPGRVLSWQHAGSYFLMCLDPPQTVSRVPLSPQNGLVQIEIFYGCKIPTQYLSEDGKGKEKTYINNLYGNCTLKW